MVIAKAMLGISPDQIADSSTALNGMSGASPRVRLDTTLL